MYCVYLTAYSGNLLPPFYIGSTSIRRIVSGYHGSVRSKKYGTLWKDELMNNPHLFKTIVVSLHDEREIAYERELYLQKKLNVIKNPLYVNLSLAQNNGYFGGSGKNNPMYGRKGVNSPTHGRTGEKHPMYGKPGYWTGKNLKSSTKKLISDNHAPCDGKNNSRALKWILTSPDGQIINCHGDIEKVTREYQIGIQLLKKHLGKIVPSRSRYATSQISKNTVGWKLEKITQDIQTL